VSTTVSSFSYVLPVHNQESVLLHSVLRLHARLREFPDSEILLVENGSSDESAALCAELSSMLAADGVAVRTATSPKGMGHALRRGMAMARGDVVVLTAADLPFDFTDLDAYLATWPRPRIAIGSKGHPQSQVDVASERRVMSEVFRWMRRATLGLRVRDSQGTIFLDASLCRRILPRLACGDFLISTEVVCWAIAEGAEPVEMPVVYPRSQSSTVSPVRDSARMLAEMVALRRRLHDATGTATALQQL